ncbi:DUF2441 domain-containing protein [Agrobacterium sp. S2]|nr:DUF2441 domain-containing protein [Agrobacterium sp. S2]
MQLRPETYWHLADRNSLLFHNAPLAKGFLPSVSTIAVGELIGATTLYAAFGAEPHKEEVFEAVRAKSYPHRPSRINGLYCFNSRQDAERAYIEWFNGANKELVELSIAEDAVIHTADSRLLNAAENEWEDKANLYWAGASTDAPLFETIVHGYVFFPGWQEKPFGLLDPRQFRPA